MRTWIAAVVAGACVLTACIPDFGDGSATHESVEGNELAPIDGTDCFVYLTPGNAKEVFAPVDGVVDDCFVSETTVPETTTTVPETTTTVPETTTTVPETTTTVPETTTTVPAASGFVATFDDGANQFETDFDSGVWHRDDIVVAETEWTGDHDENCGTPATQRPIQRDNPEDSFYECRNHLMSAIGDTSGYSIGWFSPKQTFTDETTISFDVNSTDLGIRQWWEVALVPADYQARDVPLCDDAAYRCQNPRVFCPQCTAGHSATTNTLDVLAPGGIQFGTNGGAGKPQINYVNVDNDFVCRHRPLDQEGCASKPIRRTWTFTDNEDGTVTLTFDTGTEVHSWTADGEFPPGEWKVIFKDHNYTPNKVAPFPVPNSFTWHWDNIIVN